MRSMFGWWRECFPQQLYVLVGLKLPYSIGTYRNLRMQVWRWDWWRLIYSVLFYGNLLKSFLVNRKKTSFAHNLTIPKVCTAAFSTTEAQNRPFVSSALFLTNFLTRRLCCGKKDTVFKLEFYFRIETSPSRTTEWMEQRNRRQKNFPIRSRTDPWVDHQYLPSEVGTCCE